MPFQKIKPEKVSQSVVRQIEQLILRGVLRPGARLPSERELSEKFGVSRPSVRDAVAHLQDEGLLVAKANSGIFVAEVLGSAFSPGLMRLFGSHEEAVFDYLDFRRDIEGLAARRAAKHATDADLEVVNLAFSRMEDAHGSRKSENEALLDAEFHLSIVEASHNVVMLHMMRSMYELLKDGVFYNRKIMFERNTTRGELLEQHRRINDALQKRDANEAFAAVEAHLDFVRAALERHLRADKNETVARQRLAAKSRI